MVTIAQGLERPTGFVLLSGVPPVAVNFHCPDPGKPLKGFREPLPRKIDESYGYLQASVIHYKCYRHYNLIGPKSRTCLNNGSWSEHAPECLFPPVFRRKPSNISVEEGESVLLPCAASSKGTTITWLKDEKIATGDNFFFSSWGLLIMPVYREDQGCYVCKATNRAGSKVARGCLHLWTMLDKGPACGRRETSASARIIGGTNSEEGAHPWQVGLWNRKKRVHFCGGALVSKRWVVTAAHCFKYNSIIDTEVRLGRLFTDREEPGRQQIIHPDKLKIHPHYSKITFDSDVALIHLSTNAHYTKYVKAICLPLSKNDNDKILLKPGRLAFVTGWGRRVENGSASNILQEVEVPIVNQTVCKKAYENAKHIITSNTFCAGYAAGGSDSCQGDSGGPLAIENSQKGSEYHRWVLAGVVSWGEGCGRAGKYGVYTRVSAFSKWIYDHIN